MRLLNTKTFKFENFDNPEKIKYAILSHRWVDNKEIKFENFEKSAIVDKEPKDVSKSQSPISKAE